jgi:chromosome partitioning protein
MAEILAVVNQKGGVGKTTTTVNLGAFIAARGKKVLLIDCDPQGNATSGLGIAIGPGERTTYDVLINETPMLEAIRPTGRKNLWICPADLQLTGAMVELVNAISRETYLKLALEPIAADYDFILIDCPPSLGLLTVNALAAATGMIIPIQSEYYALEGVKQLLETLKMIRRHLNPTLEIFGVVITMYDARTQLSAQVAQDVRQHFGDRMFRTMIPRTVRLSEAPSHGQAIGEYDARSRGAESYAALAREVVGRAGAGKR